VIYANKSQLSRYTSVHCINNLHNRTLKMQLTPSARAGPQRPRSLETNDSQQRRPFGDTSTNVWVMDDSAVMAAIRSEDPAGMAAAYDKYATALYDYCHWRLRQPADAAAALRDTFVVATAPGDLPEASELRPWLYSVARRECLCRLRTEQPAEVTDRPAGADRDGEETELRTLVRAVLAELKPRERELIELQFRHDLHDGDLAIVLGVSWGRVHAWAARSRRRLEKALGAVLAARTGREACPALDELLPDGDEPLTAATRELVGEHIERCENCASRQRGPLRPAALSGLLPLAPLPPELKEQVLRACSTVPGVTAYRRRGIRRAEFTSLTRFSQAIRLHWRSIYRRKRPATTTMVFAGWVAAVWAVAAVLFFFAGSR
jgi:RNA polymerase sigma factor (sigma-70 family)